MVISFSVSPSCFHSPLDKSKSQKTLFARGFLQKFQILLPLAKEKKEFKK